MRIANGRCRAVVVWYGKHGFVASRTHGERLDRLEKVIQILAEDQVSLQKLIAELATETRRGFERVQKQFEETDRRMRQTDDRMRQTDERIDKLVIAIGEFIREGKSPGR